MMQEYGDSKRAQALWDVDSDDEEEDILEPNPKLSQGNIFQLWRLQIQIVCTGNDLPRRYGEFPLEMASTPIVDIDPYYADKRTFIVINKGGAISRCIVDPASRDAKSHVDSTDENMATKN